MKDPFSNSDPITPNDTQQYCSICNGKVSNTFQSGTDVCPNCGTPICITYEGGVPPHAPDQKKLYKNPNRTYINKGVPVNSSYNYNKKLEAKRDKEKERAEEDEDTVKDVYTVEFDACQMGSGVDDERKKRLSVDERKRDVINSRSNR